MTFHPRNIQPRLAYTDYSPPGPWADQTIVTRNFDGVGFLYDATLNTLSVIPNQSYATKDANNFAIINVPDPVNKLDAANKEYVDAGGGGGGGGIPDAPSDGTLYGRENAGWVNAVPLAGGTMTGLLTLSGVPTTSLEAANKGYVDGSVPAPSTTAPPMDGTATPGTSTLYARGDHVHPSDSSKAPLTSPAFVGTPTAPTATTGTNTTQIATTAFVGTAVTDSALTPSSTTPVMDGTGSAGVATTYSRGDHVHPTDTSRAPLASPAFTGTPTAPTPTTGDSSTKIATTAFVMANAGGVVYVGVSPPSSPTAGGLWWESDTGVLYIYYNDGTSSQWVVASPQTDPGTYCVRYDTAQSLTVAQLTQARENIYAAPFDSLAYNGMQINGSMEVSQANGTNAVTSGYVVDGWGVYASGPVVSAQQVTDAPPGYAFSLKVSVTTADASPGAGDYLQIRQPVEGHRISRLAMGTASPASISIGFWVKANRTGLYSASVRNSVSGTPTRSYVFTFTISTSATWQFVPVTIPGDTAGTWAADNTIGLYYTISMLCGTTYSAAPGAWTAGNYSGATGAINGAAATTDYMQVTGVIILPGIELPSAIRAPFIMRPYDQEYMNSQRYYHRVGGASYICSYANGLYIDANQFMMLDHFAADIRKMVSMPTLPALSFIGTQGTDWAIYSPGGVAQSGFTFSQNLGLIQASKTSHGLSAGGYLQINANGAIVRDARL